MFHDEFFSPFLSLNSLPFPFIPEYSLTSFFFKTLRVGLTYMAVRCWLKPSPAISGVLWNDEWFVKCENSSGQEHNDLYPICNNYAKNGVVWIPMEEMENTLVEAFDAQGINIRKFATERFIKSGKYRKTDWYDISNLNPNYFKTLDNQTAIPILPPLDPATLS